MSRGHPLPDEGVLDELAGLTIGAVTGPAALSQETAGTLDADARTCAGVTGGDGAGDTRGEVGAEPTERREPQSGPGPRPPEPLQWPWWSRELAVEPVRTSATGARSTRDGDLQQNKTQPRWRQAQEPPAQGTAEPACTRGCLPPRLQALDRLTHLDGGAEDTLGRWR